MAAYRAAIIVYIVLVVGSCSLQRVEADTDCTAALTGLSGCYTFLANPSTTPDQKTCCAPLETVLSTPTSFQCICSEASSNSNTGALKNALLLPKSCKLSINVSEANCTQSSSTSKTPTTSTPSSPSTSTTPAMGRSPSAGIMSASPLSPLLVLTLLWSIVSFFA